MKSISALVLTLGTLLSSGASAGFVLSIQSDTFLENSGVKSLSVDIEASSTYSTNFLTADFAVDNGATFTTPPGTFGQPGQVGEGNLNAASGFAASSGNTIASLSLDFVSAQTIPTTSQEIATLSFDTTGLAPGTYNISITDIAAQNGSFGTDFVGTGGSFTITAVPEPTSFVLVGLTGAGACVLRRRLVKRSKIAQTLAM